MGFFEADWAAEAVVAATAPAHVSVRRVELADDAS